MRDTYSLMTNTKKGGNIMSKSFKERVKENKGRIITGVIFGATILGLFLLRINYMSYYERVLYALRL